MQTLWAKGQVSPSPAIAWYATIQNYNRVTCLHWHLLTEPWRLDFGRDPRLLHYRQDSRSASFANKQAKAEHYRWLEKCRIVAITVDDTQPSDRDGWRRLYYISLHVVANPQYHDNILTFDLTHKIADLRRPAEPAGKYYHKHSQLI